MAETKLKVMSAADEVSRPMVFQGEVLFGWHLSHQERVAVEMAWVRPEHLDLEHLTRVLDERNCRANERKH